MNAPATRRMSVPRLAAAARRLTECKALVEEMRQEVDWMDKTRLTAVVGERHLIESLTTNITRADTQIAQMANGTPDRTKGCMAKLESLLDDPVWAVARETRKHLAARKEEVEEYVREVKEEYRTLRVDLKKIENLVGQAGRLGVKVTDELARELASVSVNFGLTEEEFQAGRFDTAAVAVEHARQALAKAQFTSELPASRTVVDAKKLGSYLENLAKVIGDAEKKDDKRTRRTELFLISGNPVEGMSVPYKVLLRRPGYEHMPETNLYDDVEVFDADQKQFQEIINSIAEAALNGIRSAPNPPAAGAGNVRRTRPEEHLGQLDPAGQLEKIGRRMYSLLIPDAMQRLIDETEGFPLTVTSNNPELPWELLHDGEGFLCLKRMFARMPAGQTFPRRTREPIPGGKTRSKVLLIHSVSEEPLVQAEREIEEIQRRLAGMKPEPVVTKLSGSEVNARRLTDELSLGDYDLIHYAGHAGYDPQRPQFSYLLLSSGEHFRADRVQRLLEGHPVVFLNACESSKTAPQSPGRPTGSTVAHAEGLASAFVYGGAQACVGSLWPVFDDTAADLSVEFYRQLIEEKQRVGEALLQARLHSCENNQKDRITWAAYALFGDPSYRLGGPITEYGA
ncbi:hypothetical protein GCM10023081_27220 [Arthrobacter ginkgonis]|uniref:CHAT domain-containing protein n=1 Tax=Arthrobacter ginkgonis TaxID=1630594 RepID=A0ABP7CDR9_9MICC